MPHEDNLQALAELLFRVEHMDLGMAPPFELLPQSRQDVFRRRARFLSSRGVVVAGAVAADLRRALALPDEPDADERVRARIEGVARGEAA
jgi:hypothetical protein